MTDAPVALPASPDWSPRAQPIFDGAVSGAAAPHLAESLRRSAVHPVTTSQVRFEAGAHTVLHIHDGDQLLVVTRGTGHIGSPGRDLRVEAGSVVLIPAGLPHYHGAGPEEAMEHLTILYGSRTELLPDSLPWPPPAAPSDPLEKETR